MHQAEIVAAIRAGAAQANCELSPADTQVFARVVGASIADPDPLEIMVSRFALEQRPMMRSAAALDWATQVCANPSRP